MMGIRIIVIEVMMVMIMIMMMMATATVVPFLACRGELYVRSVGSTKQPYSGNKLELSSSKFYRVFDKSLGFFEKSDFNKNDQIKCSFVLIFIIYTGIRHR